MVCQPVVLRIRHDLQVTRHIVLIQILDSTAHVPLQATLSLLIGSIAFSYGYRASSNAFLSYSVPPRRATPLSTCSLNGPSVRHRHANAPHAISARRTPVHKYFLNILFYHDESDAISRLLAGIAKRLNLGIRPLDTEIVPILGLILATVLLLHSL